MTETDVVIYSILAWMAITVLCFRFLVVYPLLGFLRFSDWLEGMENRSPIQAFIIFVILLWSGLYLLMLLGWWLTKYFYI
jgi:hypothetical protein